MKSDPRGAVGVRGRQIAIVVLGVVIAAAMLVLGWWQADVYRNQGTDASRARAAEPVLALDEVAPVGVRPNGAFGRTVNFSGFYAPESQILVPLPGSTGKYRILTALVRDDGTAVPVVRGVFVGPVDRAPAPPTGRVSRSGVLLPSEPSDTAPVADGQLSSVRISVLAQRWSWPVIAGSVTLDQAGATAEGLAWEQPTLPREGGELRNGAYAVQWWVFAGFALLLAFKIARDLGREALADDVLPAARPTTTTTATTDESSQSQEQHR